MKKSNLTLSFETEKLNALKFYISKKDVDLQEELSDTMQKLYEKHVPPQTREYIEDMLMKETITARPSRNNKVKNSNSEKQEVNI